MEESSSSTTIDDRRYTYIHDVSKGPPEAIDVHHIILNNNASKAQTLGIFSVIFLIFPITCFFFSPQVDVSSDYVEESKLIKENEGSFWCLCAAESVLILPGFGVQLETHYRSGRTVRRFFPARKILKPILNECVTPVTCYWVLALIVCGEGELMLVFKELRPPVKMLVPIWKALCAAIDAGDCTDEWHGFRLGGMGWKLIPLVIILKFLNLPDGELG